MKASCRIALASLGAGIVAALSLGSTTVQAQDKWPSRRVTLVVPFAAGSVTDAMARLLADQLKDVLPQPFIVENRGGAGGLLAGGSVAKAAPDGYTLLFGGNTTHSVAQALFKSVPYDPVTDFTPIVRIGKFLSVLATNTQQPFKTIEEFVAYAKANPGKLTCGHGNSTGHITCESVKRRLGLDMARLSYTGNPQAMTDLLANNIPLMVPDFLTGAPHFEVGKAIALASVLRERSPLLPNVRTLDETVMKDFEIAPWVGIFGPAGLPADIVKQLSDAMGAILAKPDMPKRFATMGMTLFYAPSGPFAEYVKADIPVWHAHAKTAGIAPQ